MLHARSHKSKKNLYPPSNAAAAATTILPQLLADNIISDDDEKENNYYCIINLLASHFGYKPVKAFYIPYRYHILRMLLIASKRSNTNEHRNYSSNKLFSLGFKKSIQFREGIRRFATWYHQSMFQN